MLTPEQSVEWERRLGVAEPQVRVDHLLSHLLLGVARLVGHDVVFIGGTALCRTWLVTPPWSRVSEDLDLLVIGDRAEVARALELGMHRALRREYPDAAWVSAPVDVKPPAAASLSAGGATVRVQLLPGRGAWRAFAALPTEQRAVDLRYLDTPGKVTLTVPTRAGFAAMKLAAWEDRAAPRDLFDLAGLAELEAIDQHAAKAFTALWDGHLPRPALLPCRRRRGSAGMSSSHIRSRSCQTLIVALQLCRERSPTSRAGCSDDDPRAPVSRARARVCRSGRVRGSGRGGGGRWHRRG